MSKLRNRIDDIVALAYYEGSDSRPLLPDWTDRILALIAEAMLSEEAKTALLVHGPHIPSDLGKQMYGKDAEMILQQILTAAGITGAATTD